MQYIDTYHRTSYFVLMQCVCYFSSSPWVSLPWHLTF